MIKKCEEMVQYYSNQQQIFNTTPKFKQSINDIACKMDKAVFKKTTKHTFVYKDKYVINRIEKSCTCGYFLKKAICTHALAFSHLKDLDWFGSAYSNRSNEFCYRTRKGRKRGGRYKNSTKALMYESS